MERGGLYDDAHNRWMRIERRSIGRETEGRDGTKASAVRGTPTPRKEERGMLHLVDPRRKIGSMGGAVRTTRERRLEACTAVLLLLRQLTRTV